MKYKISLNNNIEINGIEINEEIFQQEMVDWNVADLKNEIDNIIDWIGWSSSENDKYLMKEDLKILMSKGDIDLNQTFFSRVSTNEFIFHDDCGFDEICEKILK